MIHRVIEEAVGGKFYWGLSGLGRLRALCLGGIRGRQHDRGWMDGWMIPISRRFFLHLLNPLLPAFADDSSGRLLFRIIPQANSGGCGIAATPSGLVVLSACDSDDPAEQFELTATNASGSSSINEAQSTWQW